MTSLICLVVGCFFAATSVSEGATLTIAEPSFLLKKVPFPAFLYFVVSSWRDQPLSNFINPEGGQKFPHYQSKTILWWGWISIQTVFPKQINKFIKLTCHFCSSKPPVGVWNSFSNEFWAIRFHQENKFQHLIRCRIQTIVNGSKGRF